MTRPDYIIVGPDPRRTDIANPGGQLTATTGLLQYAHETGVKLAFVDTLQGSFPVPPLGVRVARAARRQLQMLGYATLCRPRKGVLIFAAGPGSFLDRAVSGFIAQLFGLKTIMCLRSGHLIPFLGGSSTLGRVISALVRFQPRVLVQGQYWLPNLERAGVDPARTRVVANWLALNKPLAAQPRNAPVEREVCFVFVGWLVAEKGLRELHEACEHLVASGDDFHLKIVGGGTLQDELINRFSTSGLQKRVTTTGWVDPSDVAVHIDDADVFVVPTYLEGFPNALIEAFAHGLPAISTPVGAIPDSLVDGKNGFLVAPRNALQLADAMRRYIRNPELIAQHSAEAIATTRDKHDFRTNCARLFEAVED